MTKAYQAGFLCVLCAALFLSACGDGSGTPSAGGDPAKEDIAVKSVALDLSKASLETGAKIQLKATVSPDDASDKDVTWSSDDEDIATVTAGLVTGVSEGTTTITVETEDGSLTAECEVTVSQTADIYVGGVYFSASGTGVSGYWKNGIWNALPVDASSQGAELTSFVVADSKVYACGYVFSEDLDQYIFSGYWADGVRYCLFPAAGVNWARANSISVSGNDIYVGGAKNLNVGTVTLNRAGYWKNGEWNTLPSSTTHSSEIMSVLAAGSDLYCGGFICDDQGHSQACYWKNGTLTQLTTVNSSAGKEVRSITLSGDSVYACGASSEENSEVSHAGYWINGIWHKLTDSDSHADHIVVSGSDIYMTGIDQDNSCAGYWRNDTWCELSTAASCAGQITKSGDDIYIAGVMENDQGSAAAGYWKNGVWTALPLPDGAQGSIGQSITVVPR